MAFHTVGLRKIRRKKGLVYQIDYTSNGKRFRKVVGSNKKTAEAYQASIKEKLDKGEIGIKEKRIISFESLVTEYFNLHRDKWRPKTIRRYTGFVKDFTEFFNKYFATTLMDITQIQTRYIQESIRTFTEKGASSNKKWSANSANSYKTFLASLFKYALKKSYVEENPVSEIPDIKIEKNIKIQTYNSGELDLIFNSLKPFWSDFFKFLLMTGLRLGEALNLRWDNVLLENEKPILYVLSNPEQNWVTKTCTARKVPINKTAKSILLTYKQDSSNYVFNYEAKQIPENKPYQILKIVLDKNNINGNPHQFRHTFATDYLIKNKEFRAVYSLKEIMGHKDIKTTMQYVHLVDEYLHTSMNNLD